jgi:hypothetical protein
MVSQSILFVADVTSGVHLVKINDESQVLLLLNSIVLFIIGKPERHVAGRVRKIAGQPDCRGSPLP